MNRNTNRQEALRIAAEKVRLKKEKEKQEDQEFYDRITSGTPWVLFKGIVIFCTLMSIITLVETFVDGPSKKLSEEDWKIDRNWEWTWHKIIDVEGYLFMPTLKDWSDRVENSLEITYSPVFRTGKKLSYDIKFDDSKIKKHEEIRRRSIFTWFPVVQIFLLIPFLTFIFKRQSPWFSFARLLSMFFVFPGTIIIILYALM